MIEVNELQKRRVIGKLQRHLGGLAGKRVALLGLAFKPNTDDMREASSLVLSARLQADGATVVAYDPVAEEQARELVSGVIFADSPLDAVAGADAVVLVTEWRELLELDWSAGRRGDGGQARRRRAQRAGPRGGARGGPALRGHRDGGERIQAVILVGGQGTRLRPLTSTIPKPVVRLVDRPFISFMLEWLRGHGIDDVIMSCGFLADGVRDVLGDGSDLGIRLRFVEEPEPRGTAGALKLAEPMLDERFLMLNGDVLTDIDLTAQIAQHEASGARATLALVPVADPSAYGLVILEEDRSVRDFVEKPSSDRVGSNLISAGAYVLERDVLELVPAGSATSRSSARCGRALIGNGLYGFPSESYWLDIGTPERYLQGTFDILEGNVETRGSRAPRQRLARARRQRRGARPGDPAGCDRARRARRRGRPRRQPGRARRGRVDRRGQHRRARRYPRGRRDRRGLRAARLHRRRRLPRRRGLEDHRRSGARRGRDRGGGQRESHAGRVSSPVWSCPTTRSSSSTAGARRAPVFNRSMATIPPAPQEASSR